MTYIKKPIELKNTGHINECWQCDFKTVNLTQLPTISVMMIGNKSYEDVINGKESYDSITVSVTSQDLELNGSIGYENIPKLYEVLTTKTIEIDITELVDDVPTVKRIEQPVYPDFFGGEIITVVE